MTLTPRHGCRPLGRPRGAVSGSRATVWVCPARARRARPHRRPAGLRWDGAPANEVRLGVAWGPIDANLEVDVGPRAVPGATDVADDLAGVDLCPKRNGEPGEVCVARGHAARVLNADEVAVFTLDAALGHAATGRGVNRRAHGGGQVDSRVPVPWPLFAEHTRDGATDRRHNAASARADRRHRGGSPRRRDGRPRPR